MAREPGHLHRLLAFLDPLLRRAPIVVDAHHRSARRLQIGQLVTINPARGTTPQHGIPPAAIGNAFSIPYLGRGVAFADLY